MFIIRFRFQHYFYLPLSKISKLSNVIKKFKLSFSLINSFHKTTFDSVFVTYSKSVISKLFSPPRDQSIKINLIRVLLLHTMVFSFRVPISKFAIMTTYQWHRVMLCCCYCYFWICLFCMIFFWINFVSLLYLLLYSLWSQVSKHYHGHPIRKFS